MRKSKAVTAPAITLAEANLRIARLSREALQSRSERESLHRALDAGIRITGEGISRSIALEIEGQNVSGCSVLDYRQQIGNCSLRMGGIAGVYTHNDHRFKGYSRRVMENTLRWMHREGFDVTMLYGITGFYPKYGFATAFPEVVYTLRLRDAERAAGGECRFVDYSAEHLPAVLKLYQRNNAGRTGVIIRDPSCWRPFRQGIPWGAKVQVKVALDARNRPVAYAACSVDHDAEILEVGYASPAVFPDLLRAIAEQAWSSRTDKIVFRLPDDDLFMQSCLPLGMHKEVEYRQDGGAMVRLINLHSTLAKLAPLLGPRATGPMRITLKTNIDNIGLCFRDGKMAVEDPHPADEWVKLPQWALAQMIYGYHSGSSPAFSGVMKGTRRGLELLAVLFPARPHYLYHVDHF